MRKLTYLLFVLVAFSLFSTGCKKNEDGTPARYLSAQKDGAEWKSLFRTTLRGEIPAVGEGFVIIATTGVTLNTGEYLMITIRGTEAKKYNLSVNLTTGVAAECSFLYRSNASETTSNYTSLNGTVTLTKVNAESQEVSGTFQVTLNNTANTAEKINITNGKFENLKYINRDLTDYAK